ncbi:MAG: hypothetical protein SWX82_14975 [Cyanobacteriota bacterium]|nr:hypothetical protein [Cyanobacteriota bacterium]
MTLLPHEYPDSSNMILEDDTPLDKKQQRLLTTVFYSGGKTGINVSSHNYNVGVF